jgi:hypothetical protein
MFPYHATGIPGWTPFFHTPMGYPPKKFMPYTPIHPGYELHILEREKNIIKSDLDRIEKRIEEIKNKKKRK